MTYQYDAQHYEPPAPVIRVVIRSLRNPSKYIITDAFIDTGADITALPLSLIKTLEGIPVSTYPIYGPCKKYLGLANSYFLEFEISNTKMMLEAVAYGDDVVLGRNLLNELVLELNGPAKVVRVK